MAKARRGTPKKTDTLRGSAVLAIDPGARFGAAMYVSGGMEFVEFGKQDLATVARVIQRASRVDTDAVLVVENQFSQRGGRANPKALATLFRRRHMWEIVAEIRGLRVSPAIYPATWQTVLRESPAVTGDTKEKSRALAALRHPELDDMTDDLADALCMGLWYTRRQLVEHPAMMEGR